MLFSIIAAAGLQQPSAGISRRCSRSLSADCESESDKLRSSRARTVNDSGSGVGDVWELRSKRVKLGLLKASVSRTDNNHKAVDEPKLNLVRTVFGFWNHQSTAASTYYKAQACTAYKTEAGDIDCFDWVTKKHNTVARMKAIGLASHTAAQATQLPLWLSARSNLHAIVTSSYRSTVILIVLRAYG